MPRAAVCEQPCVTAAHSARRDRAWHRLSITFPAVVALIALMLLTGCQVNIGAARSVARENDRLREMNLQLRRQVERLETRLELTQGQVTSLRQQLDEPEAEPMPDAVAPMLARLRLARYTGGFDTTGDGRHDTIRAYVQTLDQHGRMLPVAGRARLRIVTMPDDDEPATLAERTYAPADWDAAYRSGFAGTHYTLELELDADAMQRLEAAPTATLHVNFTQAGTGARHAAQRELDPPRDAAARQ